MPELTLGWVQDAGSLSNLRKVVELLATTPALPRAQFLNQIKQTIGVGRWADDNYARFAHALGFASYDRQANTFSLTEGGRELLAYPVGSSQEKRIFEKSLLSNPPVVRILDLLKDGTTLTKFEMGQKLGFSWERGFTTYPQDALVLELSQARSSRERNKIFSNREGTSDKYVRMICSWLQDMDWVLQEPKQVSIKIGEKTFTEEIRQSYRITPQGLDALRRARGVNIRRRIKKLVPAEMLCSGNHPNSSFIRKRRVEILEILRSGRSYTVEDIVTRLGSAGIPADSTSVKLDLQGLINCGLNIIDGGPAYTLRDEVELECPPLVAASTIQLSDVDQIVKDVTDVCSVLPNEFLNLIPFSFDQRSSRFFETRTYELCKKLMGFDAELLGGSREPDVIIWYANSAPSPYGVIIDCKSRAHGYSIPINDQRQMRDYIRDFTPPLQKKGARQVYFLFATSLLRGGFKNALKDIHRLTGIGGAAVSSGAMLYLADQILSNKHNLQNIETLFGTLDKIDKQGIDRI